MPNIFSQRTLRAFEDASASIPLRQLDRVFEASQIRPGKDPGGTEGARRVQFRRYIAGVDQHDPQQLNLLGDALGGLLKEVAASKIDFLVKAAEGDGFVFADGVFRPASTAPDSFALTRVEDVASIDERARRLYLLAADRPADAIAGARQLAESLCRTVLGLIGEPAPGKKAGLGDLAAATLAALEPASTDKAKSGAPPVRRCLQQLAAVVADLEGVQRPSPRYARLAVGAAVTFAHFVAETHQSR